MPNTSLEITRLLGDWQGGDRRAIEKLAPYLYDELHRIAASYMRGENTGHTLQTTAVVNEAYEKLAGNQAEFVDRHHFFALAARIMRRILVDHARQKRAAKRGGSARHESFDEAAIVAPTNDDLVEIDAALEKLAAIDARMAKAVELRYFGGLTYEETAAAMELSITTVHEDLKLAKAWLRRELE
jgi:RNA polymerase sigma-70 factor (ECF subfamily)